MTYLPFLIPAPIGARALRRSLNRLYDEALSSGALSVDQLTTDAQANAAPQWSPACEARETANTYVLEFDMPGVSAETVEILASEGLLTVRGERPGRAVAENEKHLFGERQAGRFERRFRLPKNADMQKVSASSSLGVLTIQVAKAEPAQPLRVPVSVAAPVAG